MWLGRVLLCGLAMACACGTRERADVRSPVRAVQVSVSRGEPKVERIPSGPSATEVCKNALDDNSNNIIDEGCNEPQGDVFFALAWSDPSAKLDLIVTDPSGELAPIGRATALGLVRTRDCPGQDRECQGVNYETAVVEGEEPLSGTFTVRVRFEGTEPPGQLVRAQLGVRTRGEVTQYSIAFTRAGTEYLLSVPLNGG